MSHSASPRNRSSLRRSEEHTSELQSLRHLVCRLLLEKKKKISAVSMATMSKIHRAATCAVFNAVNLADLMVTIWLVFRPEAMSVFLNTFFFFNDTATTEIYTLSLHDALPIYIYGSSPADSAIAAAPANR